MDAVLGLSVTPSAVGLVLVEGQGADGPTIDRDAVDIPPTRRSSPRHTSDEAAAAVLRTEAVAAGRGHRLRTIGVTWSDDAETEAALLLRSLRECGFDNVVAVQLPEASEALAWDVADLIGNEVTAVCVIEYDTVMALVVHTREGAVQTAVNHSIDSQEALVRWLNTVFAKADWRPQALVLVGSGADLDAIMPRLEAVLSVPVFAPAEAGLALARGAALAAADSGQPVTATDHLLKPGRRSQRQSAHAGPLAMLAAGTVTFVVSVSAAIGLQLAPGKDTTSADPNPAAKSSPDIAAAQAPRPAAGPVPAAPPALPPAELPAPPGEPPVAVVDIPAALSDPLPAAPPPEPPIAPVPIAPVPGTPVPGAPVLPPESMAPGLVPAQPTPVPQRRGLLQRIRDRFSNNEPAVQQGPAPVDPALAPPPEGVAPPAPEAAVAPPPAVIPPPDPEPAPPPPP